MLFSGPMQIYKRALFLAAVVSFTVAPSFMDWHVHCLAHQEELALTGPDQAQTGHGVHHQDCHWLRGGRDTQALVTLSSTPVLPVSFALPLPPAPDLTYVFFPAFFSPRAPPLLPL